MEEKNKLLDDKALAKVFRRFQKNNPDPKPELYAPNAYCFLLAVVLSAQATDKSVNTATEPLFKIADTPEAILALGKEKLIQYIKQIGLYNAKSEHIIALSKKLVSDFDSKVPSTREELMSLPGVGRKTANVVLNVIFHKPTMPVDTHLLRVCPKTGIADATTAQENTIPYGIYHCTDEGETTWFDFTKEIKRLAEMLCLVTNKSCTVNPCTTEEYPTPAKRPAYSVLSKSKIQSALKIKLPAWQDSLKKFLESDLFEKERIQ